MSDEPPPSSIPHPWHSLSPDLHERILLRLPTSSAVKFASVCKQWRSLISSPSFSSQFSRLPSGLKSWFCLWGINEIIHTRSVAFAFDPTLGRWFKVPTVRPPDFNRPSLTGSHGLFFAFSGSKACVAANPLKMKWKETSSAATSRCYALLGIIGDPLSSTFSFVVVGGVLDGGDQFMVEMYDSSSDTWERCDPPPADAFRDTISCHWMSSAVVGHKFYVADYYGSIAAFDSKSRSWSKVMSLDVPDLVSLFIVACNNQLHVVAVCRKQTDECVKVFEVEDLAVNMDCKEVSEMPADLFTLFGNADEQNRASIKCVGSGTTFYVYNACIYNNYPVCLCDLSEGNYSWKQLPSLPSPPRFDRVVCSSMTFTPGSCLDRFQLPTQMTDAANCY